MAKRASISISFTPEQADFLNSLVRCGEYQSVSEVVRAALRPFQHRRAVLRAEIERARREIAVGADDLDRGRIVEGDAFFREWDADLDEWEEKARSRTR
jgi:antitoxin ParD1/3/4